MRRYRLHLCGSAARASRIAAIALVVIGVGATADAAAAARQVNIVTQGTPPKSIPANTHYFSKIQEAVNASKSGDYVLIEPGVYYEPVKVTSAQSGIWIRGMDRNKVIIDGKNEAGNGVEVNKANNVWVENLTVRNFDTGECDCGNEIWWNGGHGSGKVEASGWFGSYLTAYDTGQHGGYGIFTSNEEKGSYDNIYASGFNDSGLYIGACRECAARVSKASMENNALGYSGSNSSGELIIENSVFSHNSVGIAPNSENPSDKPPPLDGACNSYANTSSTPTFESTNIARCEVLRSNHVENNNNLTTPVNGSTEIAPWGVGIELPGDYAVLTEKNVIANNPNNGVLGFEYPNPFPPGPETIYFQLSGNRISNNQFTNNGNNPDLSGNPLQVFAGDLSMLSDFAQFFGGQPPTPPSTSVNNCVSGNSFADATFPSNIEGTWGCQNKTTPEPGGEEPAGFYILTLIGEGKALRTPTNQPAPPAQPTMPNPCEGVPKDPLCPKGGSISGTFSGPLVVKNGEEVEITGKVSGPVTVESGGALDVLGGTISGPLKANGASQLRLCGAKISGSLEAINTSGPVVIGEGTAGCTGGSISGSVTVNGTTDGLLIDGVVAGGLTASGNAPGTSVLNNSLSGGTSVTGNSGGTTVTGNSVSGSLTVTGNGGVVVDKPNTVSGSSKLQ